MEDPYTCLVVQGNIETMENPPQKPFLGRSGQSPQFRWNSKVRGAGRAPTPRRRSQRATQMGLINEAVASGLTAEEIANSRVLTGYGGVTGVRILVIANSFLAVVRWRLRSVSSAESG